MADIFIGYASEDRLRVKPLAEALEAQGWSVWWDWKSIPVGKTWRQAIEEGLEVARSILVLWSNKSINKDWVIDEAEVGKERKNLVPVIIDDVRPPIGFRQMQSARLIEWKGEVSHTGFRLIIQALTSILGSPAQKETREMNESAEHELTEQAETIENTIGMNFVLIPAGIFMMGNHISAEEVVRKYGGKAIWHIPEHPQHIVKIKESFYLQATNVTVGQWRKFTKDTGYNSKQENNGGTGIRDTLEKEKDKDNYWDNPGYSQDDNHPVAWVSWNDASEFIHWLNHIEGHNKYRLPTEAEWEYACRAGAATEFFFGNDAGKLSKYAWFSENAEGQTRPVGTKKCNNWGLYDMYGNVWDWVEDDWHEDYNEAPDDGRPWIDEPRGVYRGIRGGGWYSDPQRCGSAVRGHFPPGSGDMDLGFRLARSVALGP